MTDSSATPAVRMTGIAKRFAAVQAVAQADLSVQPGEIHALCGENGAGKSTLMKILCGMNGCDDGRIEVHGQDVTGWSTARAIAAGVGMVHQHFMLVPTLTVAENVVLGREPLRHGLLDLEKAVADVEQLCKQTGLSVPARALVAELSVGQAQRVEILKVLHRGARVLLLDEPTAVLSPPEVVELWKVLRTLRGSGTTILLVTHKLDEVMELTDRITVMRQGRTVAVLQTPETTPEILAEAMVGREVDLRVQHAKRAGSRGDVVLQLRDLRVAGRRIAEAIRGISLDVRAGEILGIAGVEGNGQAELLEALTGLRPVLSGEISLNGKNINALTPRARGDAGLSHIPEDRHERGLILEFSVADNLVLGQQHHFGSKGLLDRRAIDAHAQAAIAAWDIRPPDPQAPVRTLSGGNQQKVVIAREMARDFSVLIAAQPTRGVDVGAIEFIHDRLRQARDAGKAVLLVSAELREILTLSDRIAVLYGGQLVAVLPRDACSEAILGGYMTGLGSTTEAA